MDDIEEMRDEINQNLDNTIEYAARVRTEDQPLGLDIVKAAESIRDIVNDEHATLKFLNYTAWCMSIGCFLGVIESPNVVAVFMDDDEEEEDEPVH